MSEDELTDDDITAWLREELAPPLVSALKELRHRRAQDVILRATVGHLESAVGRLAPVVAAVERWHDKGADATGIVGALQRYREKLRGPAGHNAGPGPDPGPGDVG